MAVEVKLPQLGESTYEGTIGKWLKKPGERVEKYESLVEIITDKVNVEMPSPFEGLLTKILVSEGETVPTGTPIALMEPGDGVVTGEITSPASTAVAPATREPPVSTGRRPAQAAEERTRLSPVVRKLAHEHGIPLETLERLHGTGTGGRVTKEDVLTYLEARREAAPAPPTPTTVPLAPAPVPAPGDQVIKLTPLRRSIAQRMAQSKREIPHAYGVIEVDVTTLVRWREAHKEEWRVRERVNITYTAFFVKAAVEALKAVPAVNASWREDGIVLHRAINIGMGIALDDGLIVAVIKHADQNSLVGIAQELDALGRKARDGKLTLDEVQGGTFTITNPGVFGSIWSMPIIVPGQAAILATDAIVKRPVVRDDAIAIRDIMHLGLSFDHRVFDGAVAMQFLNRMREKLERVAEADAAVSDF